MSVGNLSLQNLWPNQLAASGAPGTSGSHSGSLASSNLFTNLIASLNGQSALNSASLFGGSPSTGVAAPATNASPPSTSGTATSAQISSDLEAFLQSLQQALAMTQGGGNASATNTAGSPATAAGVGGSNHSGAVHHGHHAHGQGGEHANADALLQELSGSANSPDAATGETANAATGTLGNVNAAFNQLMTDLGATASATTMGQLVNTIA